MANDKLSETLKQMELLKQKLNESLLKAETDPFGTAKEMGLDISKIKLEDLEKLKELGQKLPGIADDFLSKVANPENPKLKGVENIAEKIKQQGFASEKDQEVANKLMNDYINVEQSELAKGCFHYDQQSCKGGIISAHSLQKKGPLYRISERQNNQDKVVHFKRELGKKWQANLIAIKDASTFHGFCHHHDDIFSPIEQEPYTGSNQQNFLHSYRSFAYSYHVKMEKYAYAINLSNNDENLNSLLSSLFEVQEALGVKPDPNQKKHLEKNGMTLEQEKAMKADKFESHKLKLNELLSQNKFDDLEYFSYELNHICPLVCSSLIKVNLEGTAGFMIDNNGQTNNGYPLLLTVFQTERNTSIVLLARFKTDSITEIIFNQLRKLSNQELENKLTSLIFEQVENFYLAPAFWNYLPKSEKDKIENDINEEKQSFPDKSTFKASINIFDGMHKMTTNE